MIGILLAGGAGTRMFPLTTGISKQLLPVYDKPAIYYPLSILMLAGIREVVIISTPRDLPIIKTILGDGSHLGISLHYREQLEPKGIPQAFTISEDFLRNHTSSVLILGDNLFYGAQVPKVLKEEFAKPKGATLFAYHVQDPHRFGVVEIDDKGNAVSLEEKPTHPKSNWAITGLYRYDQMVLEYAKSLKPSHRGELEITDLNRRYFDTGNLAVIKLGRGVAWLDTGTPDSILSSSTFVQTIEHRQGLKISCIEEIAFVQGFISKQDLTVLVERYPECDYKKYLVSLLN